MFKSALLASVSFLHVGDAEHESEKKAKGTDGDVANGQEVVLSTEGVCGRKNEALSALERSNLVLIIDPELIRSCLKATFNSSPKFSEIWESSSSHPDDEMLVVFHINPLNLFIINTIRQAIIDILELVINI